MGVKGNWMNFIFFIYNRKNYSESIVQGISFHNELSIRDLVYKNKSRDEYFLKKVESIMAGEAKLPRDILPGEICQWDDNVQVVEDKLVIKISKT